MIQRNAATCRLALASSHQGWEQTMTLDTIMVVIAVTAMFATLAIVLGWADWHTNRPAKKG